MNTLEKIGIRVKIPPFGVTKEEIIRFAETYDPIEFHLNEEFDSPFGSLIASGIHSLALVWKQIITYDLIGPFFENIIIIGGVGIDELRWTKPVFAGDTISGEVEIVDVSPTGKDSRYIISSKVTAVNQRNEIVLTMITKGMVKEDFSKRPKGIRGK